MQLTLLEEIPTFFRCQYIIAISYTDHKAIVGKFKQMFNWNDVWVFKKNNHMYFKSEV